MSRISSLSSTPLASKLGWLLVAAATLVACGGGDDGSTPAEPADDAGADTMGTGGMAGTGGSKPEAGLGGGAGQAGAAGSSGAAGTAGAAGDSGVGGAAGTAGAGGSEPDGGAGEAGSAGSEPDGGEDADAAPVCDPLACPGTDDVCAKRICDGDGGCAMEYTADGTPISAQDVGNCKKVVCDGAGSTKELIDDTDVPDDQNDCTADTCTDGTPGHENVVIGTTCGTAGLVCDGEGACAGCMQPSDCSGDDTECSVRTCESNKCGRTFTQDGFVVTDQTPGDCLQKQCDGNGAVKEVVEDTDVPVDANDCTLNVCSSGAASNPNAPAKTPCGTGGEDVCDGAGVCVACIDGSDCPGSDTECALRSCTTNTCGVQNVAGGSELPTQFPGDCQKRQCDGNGSVELVADDADLPEDSNPCTADACNAGQPANTFLPALTPCGIDLICDGAGACVQCVTASDCAGVDTECGARTCVAGACGMAFTALGTPVSTQTPGDCKQSVCDGNGAVTSIDDDGDIASDGNQCTNDVCTNGVGSHPPTAPGTGCNTNGGTLCNGAGQCVQCLTKDDCPGSDNECGTRTCSAGVCGKNNLAAGTKTASQVASDCKVNQCDGNGNVVSVNDNTDVIVDGNQCTDDVCTAGVPSNPARPSGSACNTNEGSACNSLKQCVPSFYVLRVGTGAAALNTSATAAFLEQRDEWGTPLGAPIALPVAVSGTQAPFTVVGTNVNEGRLSLSNDGKFVLAAGYATVPGTATPNTALPGTVNRVVARVGVGGVVDTSTRISVATATSNIYTATSSNGTGLWVGGAAGGITYVPFGTTGGVQISTTPAIVYSLGAFGGQLYGDSYSGAGTFQTVFKVGTGFPTTATQTCANLTGMTTVIGQQPYEFVAFDRSSAVAGIDTLYMADARAASTGGVIQKWTFNGTTWARQTFSVGITVGARGLTGWVYQGKVQLIITTTETVPRLIRVEDDGSATPPLAILPVTPATNTSWRGLAAAPR